MLCITCFSAIALRLGLLSFVISCGLCVGHAKKIQTLTTLMTPSKHEIKTNRKVTYYVVRAKRFKNGCLGLNYALSTSPTTWLRFHSVWVGSQTFPFYDQNVWGCCNLVWKRKCGRLSFVAECLHARLAAPKPNNTTPRAHPASSTSRCVVRHFVGKRSSGTTRLSFAPWSPKIVLRLELARPANTQNSHKKLSQATNQGKQNNFFDLLARQ